VEQEDLVRAIAEHSGGAPFVFAPDFIPKGSGGRQPADLAWVCNESIVLINMTHKANASAEKLYRHNMDRLLGWLRMWKGGHRLAGSNYYKRFDLGYDDFEHVILLSVVGGRNAAAQYQPQVVNDPRAQHARSPWRQHCRMRYCKS
jgi:hypothetical protein